MLKKKGVLVCVKASFFELLKIGIPSKDARILSQKNRKFRAEEQDRVFTITDISLRQSWVLPQDLINAL